MLPENKVPSTPRSLRSLNSGWRPTTKPTERYLTALRLASPMPSKKTTVLTQPTARRDTRRTSSQQSGSGLRPLSSLLLSPRRLTYLSSKQPKNFSEEEEPLTRRQLNVLRRTLRNLTALPRSWLNKPHQQSIRDLLAEKILSQCRK